MKTKKVENIEKRKKKVRARINRLQETPRLTVFCSNLHISAQIVDDKNGKTLTSASDLVKGIKDTKGTKMHLATLVGEQIAINAKEKKIKKVVFDRGSKLYHGRVAVLAESARKHGLEF